MRRYDLVRVQIVKDIYGHYEAGKEYLAVVDRLDANQPYGIITAERGIWWVTELIEDSNEFGDIRVELCDSEWIHWAFKHETECMEV